MLFYTGCPMWGYKEWVGNLFPAHTAPADFLRLYSQKFNAVEGNTTFYALPSAETIVRWCKETPDNFRFCPKLSRDISHNPQLDSTKTATLAFTQRMRGLGERLGPMFLQFPSAFSPQHLPQLQAFLDLWPSDLRLAIEVRHPDFFTEPHATALNSVLRTYKVGRVLMDTRPIRVGTPEETRVLQKRERKPLLPLQITATTDFAFVRYIGHPDMEVNKPFLEEWAKQSGQWLEQGTTPYIFCHCPFEVHSPTISTSLYHYVRARVPLPPRPTLPEQPEQARLF